jgi:hypothetical protein
MASMSDSERPLRIVRRLRDAANAHDAPVWRVALRAARLRRDGWRLGEAAALGLLDPRLDPAACGWAVRATELEELQAALNPADAVPLAEDKRHFAEVCARHGIPAAAQVAVLERAGGPEASARAWAATLEQETPDGLVIKPVNGHRGLGVRVLERVSGGVADHHGRVTGWDALARELAGEPWPGYVVQERLRPHPELVGMSGHGLVHTLRLMTLRDDGTPARLLGARLRIATGREPVDSFRAGATGNMTAAVLDDGTLGVPVTVRPSGFGLERVPRHPRSGTPLTGFRIPDWEGALDLARRAADAFAPLRAMGWDIAPTPQGPVLIEANAWWTNLPDPGPGPSTMLAALREAASANGS